eukprot:763294-Hanusia_phi.AAC.3
MRLVSRLGKNFINGTRVLGETQNSREQESSHSSHCLACVIITVIIDAPPALGSNKASGIQPQHTCFHVQQKSRQDESVKYRIVPQQRF